MQTELQTKEAHVSNSFLFSTFHYMRTINAPYLSSYIWNCEFELSLCDSIVFFIPCCCFVHSDGLCQFVVLNVFGAEFHQ